MTEYKKLPWMPKWLAYVFLVILGIFALDVIALIVGFIFAINGTGDITPGQLGYVAAAALCGWLIYKGIYYLVHYIQKN